MLIKISPFLQNFGRKIPFPAANRSSKKQIHFYAYIIPPKSIERNKEIGKKT
jgi:hypothetical protein